MLGIPRHSLAKTRLAWPVTKQDVRADYAAIHAAADRMAPRVRAEFLAAIERLKQEMPLDAIEQAIREGRGIDAIAGLLRDETIVREVTAAFRSLQQTVIAGAEAAIAQMPTSVSARMAFDLVNPRTVEFLQRYQFNLIREVSRETIEGIRETVVNAFQHGGHPFEQARQIRDKIGLTQRMARAAANYRAALQEQDRPADQVDRMAATYEARALRQRAETIARTETIRAANEGQQQAWQQASEKGFLDAEEARRIWIVTPDDRLCFPAKTPVMTIGGWRPISRVGVGDQVLTHQDRFRPIAAVRSQRYAGPTVRMELGGRARVGATATYGHPILTKRGWVPCEQLRDDDMIRILAKPCADCGALLPQGPGKTDVCRSCAALRSNRSRWSNPEAKAAHNARNILRWLDPDERARARERMIMASPSRTPEARAKIKESAIARWLDPDWRAHQTAHNRRTAKLSAHPFQKMTKEDRERIRAMAMKARGKKARGGTWIERKVRWFLEKQGIEFEPQWHFRYGNGRNGFADFYLPGPRIVIECDGPLHLNPVQAERDQQKDEHLMAAGIEVLRFPDAMIRTQFADVATAIRQRCCFMWLPLKRITHNMTRRLAVYDIQVAEDESFVAGGIVAHNCPICREIPKLNKGGVALGRPFVTTIGPVKVPPAHPRCRCALALKFVEPDE